MSILNERFFTWSNMLTVLRQTSINAVIATGMTFAILIGGIDLSVGSVLAICGAIAATLISSGMNIILVIIITLSLGLGIGTVNGLFISKGRLQPFIATLGTMTLLRGFTLVFTQGKPISIFGSEGSAIFSKIGTGYFLKIPIPVYIMIIVFIIAYYILRHMRIGRYTYSLGSNEEATMYSGIKTDNIKLFVYGISGLLAALAGIIVTARLGSAQPTAGVGYELDAIAAVVIGGTSMAGGIGTIFGTAVGALIIGILNNALNLLQVSSYYQDVAKGVVILIAVLLDRKQKSSR
jgi:ribose transport system permease protein